ncbi:hypothetical protein [Xenorhabdus sp. PB62.4]|uniref:hypothetical protein n=1 Tax=Xenorhabdus sp. PB62.4 TaxID=1851573 RepID=UPI001656E803|nr:hypothetical protein [Xenorhabdus sp. PB62.4]MBC8955037.1 hypothetical protein [Xenorhabdus sp. PB62.4]
MANITKIVLINNHTKNKVGIFNGENHSQHSILPGRTWSGEISVPWIREPSENWKALKLTLGPTDNVYIYIFQDYWSPPYEDAVKYLQAQYMDYSGSTQEIPGHNRHGGNKTLTISQIGENYYLKMDSV